MSNQTGRSKEQRCSEVDQWPLISNRPSTCSVKMSMWWSCFIFYVEFCSHPPDCEWSGSFRSTFPKICWSLKLMSRWKQSWRSQEVVAMYHLPPRTTGKTLIVCDQIVFALSLKRWWALLCVLWVWKLPAMNKKPTEPTRWLDWLLFRHGVSWLQNPCLHFGRGNKGKWVSGIKKTLHNVQQFGLIKWARRGKCMSVFAGELF